MERGNVTVVLVCGSRDWTDEAAGTRVFRNLPYGHDGRIHGDATGADRSAPRVARRAGHTGRAVAADPPPGPPTRARGARARAAISPRVGSGPAPGSTTRVAASEARATRKQLA